MQNIIVLLIFIMLAAFFTSMHLVQNRNHGGSTASITNAQVKPSTSRKTSNRQLGNPSKRMTACLYLDIIDNKTWVSNTIKLLRLGRYLGFDKRIMSPSLYATYHYIASLSLLKMHPSNLNATLKYLYYLNKKYFNDRDTKLNNIIEIFYGIESLRLLGYKPLKSKELIDKILAYIRENRYKNDFKLIYIYTMQLMRYIV